MGSDLYDVRAVSKKDRTVSLDVRVVHPDAMYIPADPSFALMMLREGADDDDPIAKEIAFEDTLDQKWMTKFAKSFIAAVAVRDLEETKKSMRATMDVTVTDPSWIEHLAKGKEWSSRAFELVRTYDEPKDEPAAPVRIDDAFVWVPRECFVEQGAPEKTPALLEMIAYAPSAYSVTGEMKKKIDRPVLESWIGRAVMVRDEYSTAHGSLAGILDEGIVAVVHIDPHSHGVRQCRPKSIGRLVPKPGRRGGKLGYDRIWRAATITVASVRKNGASLELVLRVPPDGRRHPIESETDVLDILIKPLRTNSWMRLEDSALAKSLERDLDARGLEGANRLEEIYPEIARRYVESIRVEATPFHPPKWDDLTPAKAREMLAAPWPTVTIHAVVTDPKWIAHLDGKKRIAVREDALPPAMEKPPEPKRPKLPTAPPPDTRAVLVKGDRVWLAERRASVVSIRTGMKSKRDRPIKTKSHPSPEKAQAALDKDVEAKAKDGWTLAPTGPECAAIVEKRLGLAFDDTTGTLHVTKVGPPSDAIAIQDMVWFKLGDRVTGVGPMGARESFEVTAIEELAMAIAPVRAGTTIYLQCTRPASNISTAAGVRIR